MFNYNLFSLRISKKRAVVLYSRMFSCFIFSTSKKTVKTSRIIETIRLEEKYNLFTYILQKVVLFL